jgi:hypothetical protein
VLVLVSFKVTHNGTFVYVKNVESSAHTQLNGDTPFAYTSALDDLVRTVRVLTEHSTITCIAGAIEATVDKGGKVTSSPLLPDWIGHNPQKDIREKLEMKSGVPLKIINEAVSPSELILLSRTAPGWMPEALTTAHSLARP